MDIIFFLKRRHVEADNNILNQSLVTLNGVISVFAHYLLPIAIVFRLQKCIQFVFSGEDDPSDRNVQVA